MLDKHFRKGLQVNIGSAPPNTGAAAVEPPKMLCTGGNEAPAGGREPKEKAPPLLAEAKVKLPGWPAAPPKPPKPLPKPPPLLLPPGHACMPIELSMLADMVVC